MWALALCKRSIRFQELCTRDSVEQTGRQIVRQRFERTWRNMHLFVFSCIRLLSRVSESTFHNTPAQDSERDRVNLKNNAFVLECAHASFVSDCCLSLFVSHTIYTFSHTYTITQSHKHDCINIPQILSPDPRGLPRFSFVTSTTELSFRVLVNSLPGPEASRCAGWHFGYVQFVLHCTDMLRDGP